jgi:hypothetical protein
MLWAVHQAMLWAVHQAMLWAVHQAMLWAVKCQLLVSQGLQKPAACCVLKDFTLLEDLVLKHSTYEALELVQVSEEPQAFGGGVC